MKNKIFGIVLTLMFLLVPFSGESHAVLGDTYHGISVNSIKNAMEAAYLHDGYSETSFADGWLDDAYIDEAFLKTRLFPDIGTSTLEVGDIILPLYVQYVTADRLISKADWVGPGRSIDFASWFQDADLQMAWARVAARRDLIKGIADIAAAVKEFSQGQQDAISRDRLKTALEYASGGVPELGDVASTILGEVARGTSAENIVSLVSFALAPSFGSGLQLVNTLTIAAVDSAFGYSDLRQAYLLYYIGHKSIAGWNGNSSYPLVDMMMKASSGQDGNASGINQCLYWAGRPYDTGYPYTGGYNHEDGDSSTTPVTTVPLLPKPVTGALNDYWGQWGKILFHASASDSVTSDNRSQAESVLTLLSSVFKQYQAVENDLGVSLEQALSQITVATQEVSPTANSCSSLGYFINLQGPAITSNSLAGWGGWDDYLTKIRSHFARKIGTALRGVNGGSNFNSNNFFLGRGIGFSFVDEPDSALFATIRTSLAAAHARIGSPTPDANYNQGLAVSMTGGWRQTFPTDTLYVDKSGRTFSVGGDFRGLYRNNMVQLGFPLTNREPNGDGFIQYFDHGYIFKPTTPLLAPPEAHLLTATITGLPTDNSSFQAPHTLNVSATLDDPSFSGAIFTWRMDGMTVGSSATANIELQPGKHLVYLIVRFPLSPSDTVYWKSPPITVNLSQDPTLAPKNLAITSSKSSPLPGEEVVLTAHADDPSNIGLSYAWYDRYDYLIGYGSTHRYTQSNSVYTATVKATNNHGTAEQSISLGTDAGGGPVPGDQAIKPYYVEGIGGVPGYWVSTFDLVGTINGDVSFEGGTLNIVSGQTLTINGSLIHSGGDLKVNGGHLVVNGDYRIQSKSSDGSFGASGGILDMRSGGTVTVNGSFVMDSSSDHRYYLTAGTLDVKGNFTQKSTYCIMYYDSCQWGPNYNFSTSGTHRVILSGTSNQTVSFEDPIYYEGHFNILQILNASAAVDFATPAYVTGELVSTSRPITNQKNLRLSGTAVISNGSWNADLTVDSGWTPQQNQVITRDLYLTGAALDLNGKGLTVRGNLLHSGGYLQTSGGQLNVTGDYRIQTRNSDGTYTHSGGVLDMRSGGAVNVNGSFVMDSSADHRSFLTAGTLEVKGNFTQKSTYCYVYYGTCQWGPDYNFSTSGTHRVVLSGTTKQTVSFEDPGTGGYGHFNILQITNGSSAGVDFVTSAYVIRELVSSNSTIDNQRNLRISDAAIISSGSWKADLTVESGWVVQQPQTITGDLYLTGNLDLNGKSLTVGGNIYHSGGTLSLNGGQLHALGDYRIQTRNSDGSYTYSSGILDMRAGGTITVNGSFVMDSSGDHRSYLTAGTLDVKGDFTQKSSYCYVYYGTCQWGPDYNFSTSGTHRVILSGTSKQTVSFEDPGTGSYGHFNILQITNNSIAGVEFATSAYVIRELASSTSAIGNQKNLRLSETAFISGGNWTDDATVDSGWTMQQTQVITRDLYLTGGSLDLNGKSLTVQGNIYHTGGTLSVNGGELHVGGDYLIQRTNSDGTFTYSGGILDMRLGGNVTVNGSFVMDSASDHRSYLTSGTLDVKGDFTQKSSYCYMYYGSCNWGPDYNFSASGNHKVVLSGTGRQTVSFEDPGSGGLGHFNVLEITNNSADNVVFLSDWNVTTLLANGHKLNPITVRAMTWTLNENVTVKGDLRLEGNSIDLNGKSLTVEGNMFHSNGTLTVNGGQLNVLGDYRIQTRNSDGTYTYSGGVLDMRVAGTIMVGGSFVMDSVNDHRSYLTAGTLEVKGNFTQKSTYCNMYYGSCQWGPDYNFSTSGTHKMVLSGTARQTVSFEDPGDGGLGHFNILEIANNSADNVVFLSDWNVITLLANGHKLNPITVRAMTWTLSENVTIKGDLKLEGNSINLNGKSLTVEGNLLHSGGYLQTSGGQLNVTGDYRIQTRNSDGTYTYSGGILDMRAGGTVTVNGAFVMDSANDHRSYLTAGTLEVRGDFTQKSSYCYMYYGSCRWGPDYNFSTSESHKVVLSGIARQTVSFEDPGSGGLGHFNILEITNTSTAGVLFATKVVVTTLFEHHNRKFTITDPTSEFPDFDGDGHRDHEDSQPTNPLVWAPDRTLTVTLAGNGGGSVNTIPSGVACTSGTCSGAFIDGMSVTVTALADTVSTFAGWSGACTGTVSCSPNMTADRSITATFTLAPKAMIDSTGYGSLGLAYVGASPGVTILALGGEHAGNLTMNSPKIITIKGGYRADYGGRTGLPTVLKGSLRIGSGRLTVDGLRIR